MVIHLQRTRAQIGKNNRPSPQGKGQQLRMQRFLITDVSNTMETSASISWVPKWLTRFKSQLATLVSQLDGSNQNIISNTKVILSFKGYSLTKHLDADAFLDLLKAPKCHCGGYEAAL